VSLLDQEIATLQDDVRLVPDFNGVSICSIVSFLITVLFLIYSIVLSVLRFTASDYPFHIRFFILQSGGKREPLKSN
jgi:hypothetical protein